MLNLMSIVLNGVIPDKGKDAPCVDFFMCLSPTVVTGLCTKNPKPKNPET